MKYQIDEVVYDIFDSRIHGKVLDCVSCHGMYVEPFYKLLSKQTKSGYVWVPEWLLTSKK